MKFLIAFSAFAWHFSLSLAFYPYHIPPPDSKTANNPSRRDASPTLDASSLTVGLHRVPWKRASAYQIKPAENPSAPNSAGIAQDGADYSYMCEVKFGSSKKSMYLLLDTAAVNTWVMSSDCTTESCTSHNTYGSKDSTTLKSTQSTFSISYGTGRVAGNVASDDVTFIGKTFPFTFGMASTVSDEFLSYPMDGIMGVGLLANVANGNNAQGVKAPTIVDALYDQKIISAKIYGMRLSRSADGKNDGVINFGGPDTSAYNGDLNYVSILKNNRGFWEVPLEAISFNGKTASIQKSATLLLDSGTSFMLVPPSDAAAIHDVIPGSSISGETFIVPCDTKTPVVFHLGGKEYKMQPVDFVGGQVSDGKCASNIVGRQTFEPNQWLVGDVFLKNVYAVYDADASRVGFAALKGSSTESLSPTPQPSPTPSTVPSVPSTTLVTSPSPNSPPSNPSSPVSSPPQSPSPAQPQTSSSSGMFVSSSLSSSAALPLLISSILAFFSPSSSVSAFHPVTMSLSSSTSVKSTVLSTSKLSSAASPSSKLNLDSSKASSVSSMPVLKSELSVGAITQHSPSTSDESLSGILLVPPVPVMAEATKLPTPSTNSAEPAPALVPGASTSTSVAATSAAPPPAPVPSPSLTAPSQVPLPVQVTLAPSPIESAPRAGSAMVQTTSSLQPTFIGSVPIPVPPGESTHPSSSISQQSAHSSAPVPTDPSVSKTTNTTPWAATALLIPVPIAGSIVPVPSSVASAGSSSATSTRTVLLPGSGSGSSTASGSKSGSSAKATGTSSESGKSNAASAVAVDESLLGLIVAGVVAVNVWVFLL